MTEITVPGLKQQVLRCFAQHPRHYLVFLAGWSRRLDELLKDAQAHEGDVLNNHRSLDVHCHQEEAES